MSKRLDADCQADLLRALASLLERLRSEGRTLTYLEVADHLAVPGPHRIHKTTRLLEILLKQDSQKGRVPRSALVVSRRGSGRPAIGFFERAQRLGLFDGQSPDEFHDHLLGQLFRGRGS
jgi:hypothetical protein